MSFPTLAYAGVTSDDPDFVVATSIKQQLLADSRITRWFAARDGDVDLSTGDATKIVDFKDRKAVGNAITLSTDATRPALTALSAYGGKKAAVFTDGADRSAAISGLDLSGTFFMAMLVAKSKTAPETFFSCSASKAITLVGATSGVSPTSAFQFFRGNDGVTLHLLVDGLDTTPHLLFAGASATQVEAANGRRAAVTTAITDTAPAANTTAYWGRGPTGTPNYPGGSSAQLIFGNVDIFASGNADLRELICQYVEQYYGLTV